MRTFASIAGVLSIAVGASAWLAHAADDSSAQTIASLEQAIAATEHEIRQVRDHDEIENLIGIYGYYLDKLQWDQLTDLFAEDGTIELGLRGVYVGKKSIRQALNLLGEQGPRRGWLNNHIQLQPVIHVADDGLSAKVRSRAFIQVGEFGGRGDWGEGIYENEFVKQDGVWKFKSLRFFHTFGSEYDKGWAKDARPAPPGVSDKIPPDRPPTSNFEMYPKVFVPPFHYENPAKGASN
jgi:hypothetical protein